MSEEDTPITPSEDWRNRLDERQRQEVAFATEYTTQFNHGTTGHNQLLLIHRLAELLEYATTHNGALPPPLPPQELVLTFGKYRGRTLGQLMREDIGYVDWLSREARDESVRDAALQVIRHDFGDASPLLPDEPPF